MKLLINVSIYPEDGCSMFLRNVDTYYKITQCHREDDTILEFSSLSTKLRLIRCPLGGTVGRRAKGEHNVNSARHGPPSLYIMQMIPLEVLRSQLALDSPAQS
jgi:hypothetical protein